MDSKIVPKYYFAYGSNLLSDRVAESLRNPKFKCCGVLKGYEFLFSGPVTKRWHGAAANVKPAKDKLVFGAIYTVTDEDLDQLDIQEAVAEGHYERVTVDVLSLDDGATMHSCVTYQKVVKNEAINPPSPAYKNVIINGAKRIGLPDVYIQFLRSFKDNGYQGHVDVNLPAELYNSS